MSDAPQSPAVMIPSISPRDGEVHAEVPGVTADALPAVFERARSAQRTWAATPMSDRARVIKQIHKRFLERGERFVELLTAETGKPAGEAWTAEVIGNGDLFPYWAKHAKRYLKTEKISVNPINYPGKKAFLEYVPRGVIGVIAPWNFPVAIPCRAFVPALMAGNAVVFKPSSQCPRLGELLGEVFAPELPDGLFQVVLGRGSVGSAFVDAGADFIAFTGSVGIGRRIASHCGENLVPCALELGGKDAAIVLEDCDLDRTAYGVVWGAFNNAGQNCASIERVYVVRSIAERFVARVKELTLELRDGEDFGPLTTVDQRQDVIDQVDRAREAGATVLTGGEVPDSKGFWYPATILTDVSHEMDVMTEETFGPLMPIKVVEDEEEAVRLANDCKYGLTASVWTKDRDRGLRIASQLEAGVVTVNNHGFTAAMPNAPWSGVKETGFGATNSHLALMEMVRPRFVLVDRSSRREMWWYPYNEALLTVAAALRDLALGKLGVIGKLIKGFLARFK